MADKKAKAMASRTSRPMNKEEINKVFGGVEQAPEGCIYVGDHYLCDD
ncbi:MAG: hypothetical protein PVF65_10950 [Sphingomonadales bacterium]|jgi:hypothetical protein